MNNDQETLERLEEDEKSIFSNETYKLSKYLLEVDDVPEEVKTRLWAFFNKVMELSNFMREDVNKIMLAFDDAVLAALQSIPKHKYTWQLENYITNARVLVKAIAMRSVGGTQRERAMIVMQIKQFIGLEEPAEAPRGGLLSRWWKR